MLEVIKDIKSSFTNAESCLDKKEISKLTFTFK